jgi:hypothetical protein
MISKEKTVIIMDWDDTLFPTSWINKKNINLNDPRDVNKYSYLFNELDEIVSRILIKSSMYGTPLIITNATKKWVKLCLNTMTKTNELINNKVNILSARDKYQEIHNDSMKWKVETFKELYHTFFPDTSPHQNIISIGDAEYEHIALVELYEIKYSGVNHKYLKSIRLIKNPEFKSLKSQLEKLYSNLDYIITIKKHVELEFSKLE